jgi:hypothetical protein
MVRQGVVNMGMRVIAVRPRGGAAQAHHAHDD